MQDEERRPLAGYTLAEATELIGDEADRGYAGRSGASVAALKGRPVRLKTALKDADLYSYRFGA
jgi:hypothetical protein